MKREEFEARKKAAEEAKASKLRNAPKKLYVQIVIISRDSAAHILGVQGKRRQRSVPLSVFT